jgi:hypothetical protein
LITVASFGIPFPVIIWLTAHIAMVIGYNSAEQSVFRTDTWGEGGRNKRTPWKDLSGYVKGYAFFRVPE